MSKFRMTKQKFIHQWLRCFAADLAKDDFEKYVKNQYIWHVFSYNLIPAEGLLVGDAARTEFDRMKKTDCLSCDFFGFGVSAGLPARVSTAADLDAMTECYVVSKDSLWTYIKTHEGDAFGPYFLKKSDGGE